MHQLAEHASPFLEVLELVVGGGGGGEQGDFAGGGDLEAELDDFPEVVFEDVVLGQRGVAGLPLIEDALAGGSGEGDVGHRLFLEELQEQPVLDAAVVAAQDERVHASQGPDGSYGGFRDGGDAVVVEGDALVLADVLDAVGQAVEGVEAVYNLLVRQVQLAAHSDGGHNIIVVVRAGEVVVVRQVVLVLQVAGDGKVDDALAAAGIRPILRLGAEDAAVAIETVALDEPGNVLVVAVIDEELPVVLISCDVELGDLVVVEGVEVVEMLLVDVEEHGVVGRAVDELELVGGEFGHDGSLVVQLFDDVEEGHADVAGEECLAASRLEDVVDERGGGALAFCAGDAHHLLVAGLQEEVALRGDALGVHEIVEVVKADAWGFQDKVVVVEPLVVALAGDVGEGGVVELVGAKVGVPVGHGDGHIGEVFAQEEVRGDALLAEAEDDDLAASEGIDDIVGRMHS